MPIKFSQLLPSILNQESEAAAPASTQATKQRNRNRNISRQALGALPRNERSSFLGLLERRNRAAPYFSPKQKLNMERALTLPAGNPVRVRSRRTLGLAQVQQSTNTYEKILRKSIHSIVPASPASTDMPLPDSEKAQILREIYSALLATYGDMERARTQAVTRFLEMFPDVEGNEDYVVRILLIDAVSPVKNPAGNVERWMEINNNCAEKAVVEFAKIAGRDLPRFNYRAGANERIWGEQIQFGNYVSYLNREKNIPQHKIENPQDEAYRLQSGLAQELLKQLRRGGQEKIYLMRTGYNNGPGHFQLTYFDKGRNRWVAYSSDGNNFDITDGNGNLTDICGYRLLCHDPSYAVHLDELAPEKIDQYVQFIVRCRDQKNEFAL